MPRPRKHRNVKCSPTAYYFKPRAVPLSSLEEIILEIDELEALRLGDYLALSHEQSAGKMKISRATFGRIIEKARCKVVDAILNGKAIKIGDEIPAALKEKSKTKCNECCLTRKKNTTEERNNYIKNKKET